MNIFHFSGEEAVGQDIILHATDDSAIVVPDAKLLFNADFNRDGPDLVLWNEGRQDIRIVDYFRQANAPDIETPEGAVLKGSVVEKLAGPLAPGQYAQSAATDGAEAIGQVEELSGSATVQRADGTVEPLAEGTKVFQNDVVQTADGSTISITFVDGTIFTLASASRMVLDELIYDPASDANSGVFNLVEGSFVFIAGQVAKTGGIEVQTPSATMGIRGTTVKVDIVTVNGVTTVEISLNTDPNGDTGAFTITDLSGNLIANVESTETMWIISPVEGETREIPRTVDSLATDQSLLTEAANAYQDAVTRVEQGGNFVEGVDASQNSEEIDDTTTEGIEDGGESPEDSGTQEEGSLENTGQSSEFAEDFNPDTNPLGEGEDGSNLFSEGDLASNGDGTGLGDGLFGDGAGTEIEDQPVDTGPTELSIIPPTVTLAVNEDGSFQLNGLSISGPPGSIVTATLIAGSTVELVANSGVTIVSSEGTAPNFTQVVIEGTIDQIANAINGLTYQPSENEDVQGTLQITFSADGLADVSQIFTITVNAINDAPILNTVAFTGNEDAPINGQLSATDAEGDAVTFALNAQATNGIVVLNNDGSYTYTPNTNFTGSDSFSVSTSDGTDTSTHTVNLTINPVNDAPIVSVADITVDEDAAISVTGLSVTDVDAGTSDITVTLTASNGTLTVDDAVPSGLTAGQIATNGTGTVVLTGTLAEINTTLAAANGVSFQGNPNITGAGTITVTANDGGASGTGGALSDTETINVTINPVNDAPVVALGASAAGITVNEDTPIVLTGLSVSDIDAESSDITVTLTASDGTLAVNQSVPAGLPSGDIANNSSASVTLTGTVAEINATLADANGVVFQGNPNANGVSTITVTANDGGATGSGGALTDTQVITVDVTPINDAPIVAIGASVSGITVDEDAAISVTGLSVTDVDAGTSDITVTLTASNGTLTVDDAVPSGLTAGQIATNGTGTVVLTGTLAEINTTLAAANGVSFQGNPNITGAGTITVTANDGGASGTGGALSDTETINVTINPVNDAPVVALGASAAGITVNEDTPIVLTGLSVSDIDAESSDITVTLTASDGTLAVNQSVPAGLPSGDIANNSSASVTLTGTVAEINATLADANGVVFQGNPNANGVSTITVTANDGGATGSGGALTDTQVITVDVTPINDAPTTSGLPPVVEGSEDLPVDLDFSSFTIADIDGDNVILTFTTDFGTFSAPADGASIGVLETLVNSTTITLEGTPAAINTYLTTVGNITLDPVANAAGTGLGNITVTLSDLDSEDTVQTTQTIGTVPINLTAVDDDPTATGVPTDITVTERFVSDIDLSAVTFADIDSANITVTLQVSAGEFLPPAQVVTVGVNQVNATTITLSGPLAAVNSYLDTASNIRYVAPDGTVGDNVHTLTVSADVPDGSGGTNTIVLDTINLDVVAGNSAPILTGLANITVFENDANATPQFFATGASFNDVDNNLDGGQLVVDGLLAEDIVAINAAGDGVGEFDLAGPDLEFEGTVIGGFSGGNGAPFIVNFNGNATSTIIEQLVQNLTYQNTSDNPTASRDLTITITDSFGASTTTFGNTSFLIQSGMNNPLNGVDVGDSSRPHFNDFDDDGDLDLFVAAADGTVNLYENDGGAFTLNTGLNPFFTIDLGTQTRITFADLDGNGLDEAFIGDQNGTIRHFDVVGTAFTESMGADNPFNGVDFGNGSQIAFSDVDRDGDLDAFISTASDGTPTGVGQINYFENDGSGNFTELTGAASPIASFSPDGQGANLAFLDLDNDGDEDLYISNFDGDIRYFENVGGAFLESPFGIGPIGTSNGGLRAFLAFGDTDGDGSPELVIGGDDGTLDFFESFGANPVPAGLTINVTPQNEAPTGTGLPSDLTVTEDVATNIDLSSVEFSDPDGDQLTVRLTVDNGTLTFVNSAVSGFTQTSADAGQTIVLVGPAAAINTYLDTVTNVQYQGALNANGSVATLSITVDDGSGAVNVGTVPITATAVNDAPVVNLGASASGVTVDEDTPIVVTGLSVSDVDAGSNDITVTLTASNGTLTLNESVSGGLGSTDIANNGTGSITLTGTVSQINATLADASGVTFQGNANVNGMGTISVTANDGGSTGTGGAQSDTETINVTITPVNDPPVVDVSGVPVASTSTAEDTPVFITGITVSDVDAGVDDVEVTLTVQNGVLNVSDAITGGVVTAEIQDNGTNTVVLTASLSKLNTTFADAGGLQFVPAANFAGTAQLTVSIDDGGNGDGGTTPLTDSEMFDITVTGANDAPTATGLPATINATEDTVVELDLSGLTVADADGDQLTLTLSFPTGNGVFLITGAGGDPAVTSSAAGGNQVVTVVGTAASINTYLDTTSNLRFDPAQDVNGTVTITATLDDGIAPTVNLGTFDVDVTPVNDAPIADPTALTGVSGDEDTAIALPGLVITDVDAGNSDITVTLSTMSGTLNVSGSVTNGLMVSQITNNGTNTVTLTGTLTEINTTLADASGLSLTPPQDFNTSTSGTIDVQVNVNDGGATGSGGAMTANTTFSVTVDAVNDAPTATGLPVTAIAGTEDNEINLDLSGLTVADVEGDILTLTLTVPTVNGTFLFTAGAGVTVDTSTSGANEVLTITGAVANINSYLDTASNVRLDPAQDVNGTVTISASLSDGTAPTVSLGTFDVDISAVNDAPIANPTALSGVSGDEDTAIALPGLVITDVDAGTSDITVTLSTMSGTLNVSGSVTNGLMVSQITNNGTNTVTLTGTLTEINTTLADASGLSLTPPQDFNTSTSGTIDVQVNVNDGGATGSGGAMTANTTFSVTVDAVNDPATGSGVPSTLTVVEDVATNIDLSGITVVDVEGDLLDVRLSVDEGALTFTNPPGSNVNVQFIGGTATISIQGTAADINTFLDGTTNIQYQGATNVNGNMAATLTATVNDGSGAVTIGTSDINITAVNDAPVFNQGSVPGTLVLNEDQFTFLTGLSVSDVDAGNADVTVTLTASNAFFTLDDTVSGGLDASQITNNGTGNVTLVGTVSEINTTLGPVGAGTGIRIQGNQDATGNGTATFFVDDGGASGAGGAQVGGLGIFINILPENDAPTITGAPNDVTATEDTASPLDLSSTVITDVDGDNVAVTLTVNTGAFSTPADGSSLGVTASLSMVNQITLSGSPANITTYLDTPANIQYTGPNNVEGDNAAILTIVVSDAFGSVCDTVNIDITAVNDPPTATGIPADITVTENAESQVDLSGFTLADVDSANHIVSLTVSAGTFTNVQPGSVVSGALTVNLSTANFQVISITGPTADINTYLSNPANITYTGPVGVSGNDQATITVVANDGDGSGAVTLGTVNIDITALVPNQAPTIDTSGVNPELITNGGFEDGFDGAAAVTFVTTTNTPVINGFTVTQGRVELLTGTNLEGDGENSLSLGSGTSGSAARIETTFDTVAGRTYELTFDSNEFSSTTGNNGFVAINGSFIPGAQGGTFNGPSLPAAPTQNSIVFTATGSTTTVAFQGQFASQNGPIIDNVSVREVLPDNTVLAQQGATSEIAGIQIDDPDSGLGAVTVTLSVAGGGTLNATAIGGVPAISGSGTATVTLTGTVAEINAALAASNGLTFTDAAGTPSLQTLTITVDDGGNTGTGGALMATTTLDIVVGNTASVVVGTDSGTDVFNGAAGITGGDDIVLALDGTNIAATSTGNDIYIGGEGTEDVDGQQGDDVLVGNGGNDQLDGFSGFDTLLGGEGEDRLVDLSAENGFYDGGTGQDALIFSDAGTIDLTAIANANITSIERIEINSGTNANTLILNETDIFDLSETSNTVAEGLLGETRDNVILIQATAEDTVNIEINDPASFSAQVGTAVTGFTVIEILDTMSMVVGTVLISDTAAVNLPVNIAPVLSTNVVQADYTEGSNGVIVNDSITVFDGNNSTITSATVSITTNFQVGDTLLFQDTGSITGSFDAPTGVLTLTGNGTFTEYQDALRSITYLSTIDDVSDLIRTVEYIVNDGLDSNTVTSTINPTSVNDGPTISFAGTLGNEIISDGSFETFNLGGQDIVIVNSGQIGSSSFSVTNVDVDVIAGSLFDPADGNQIIDLAGGGPGAISATFNTVVGQEYQVTFQFAGNPDSTTNVRTIDVSVGGETLTISRDANGNTRPNITYETATINFTATSTSSTLTFTADQSDPAPNSILIDDVSVRQVQSETVSTAQSSTVAINGIVVGDPDNPNGTFSQNITATLSIGNGTLNIATVSGGATVSNNLSQSVTLSGTLAQVNATLATLGAVVYDPGLFFEGVALLNVAVNDLGNFGSGVATTTTEVLPIIVGSPNVVGTSGVDNLSASNGQHAVGLGGDDDITFNGVGNIVQGGEGNDTISSATVSAVGENFLFGDAGNDIITGAVANETIFGGAGNDTLDGGLGINTIYGGEGNDTFIVSGNSDRLIGEAGDDVFQSNASDLSSVSLIDGGSGLDTLEILDGGNVDLTAISDTLIQGVEQIDLTNGAANTLTLALNDVLSISDEANTDLEAALNTLLPNSLIIETDNANDAVQLDDAGVGAVNQTTSVNVNGTNLDVYEFVEAGTGNVLATVAVDDQAAVTVV